MSNDITITALPRRNATAVEQTIREHEALLRDGLRTIQVLQATVAQLSTRLEHVEHRLARVMGQQLGTGPTER